MDIEGAEYEVLESLSAEDWLKTEALILSIIPPSLKLRRDKAQLIRKG